MTVDSLDSSGTSGISQVGEQEGAICVRVRIARRSESFACPLPVSFGVALPESLVGDDTQWDVSGAPTRWQTKVLGHWPNGSAKWLQVTLLLHAKAEYTDVVLRPLHSRPNAAPVVVEPQVHVSRSDNDSVVVSTGVASFEIASGDERLLSRAWDEAGNWLTPDGCRVVCSDGKGSRARLRLQAVEVREWGPVRAIVDIRGRLGGRSQMRFQGNLSFFAGSGQVRAELTMHNPKRARHHRGYWDLGDPGSTLLQDLTLEVAASLERDAAVCWLEHPDAELCEAKGSVEIYQDSSGGRNWKSRNHVNRDKRIPLRFQGYRVRAGSESFGIRANPVVAAGDGRRAIGIAMEEFWQQFPSSIALDSNRLAVGIWPGQFDDLHELQAGECNTRVVWLSFGKEPTTTCRQLAWVHTPPEITIHPDWTSRSGAVPFLPNSGGKTRQEAAELIADAVSGPHSFFAKREEIDEYGWRNFGDTWADHEQAYYAGPPPVISHYNNQYDLLYGWLIQFLTSGDYRWWQLADPLARHLMDIDIYRTDRDKSTYSGGMFWHTAHYHDAGTCSHRSYSTAMRDKAMPAPGGGPANEHNYGTGLLLYYWLTGNERAREAVVELAEWVIAMDDGAQHLLGLVCDDPTGAASGTRSPNYHGPGRGAGNSINALLDGWQATGREHYLDKAEELIRRTIHPQDDIEELGLLDVEDRWSYTVHLQTLARFCTLTASVPRTQACRDYCTASLLHYARWMERFERPYLDRPEQLEFPTETWAAQDLRKGNILLHAATFEPDAGQREQFCRRGREILDAAWRQLVSFDTRTCTRPLAVVLQQSYIETYLNNVLQAESGERRHGRESDFGRSCPFVPQKEHVRTALKTPAGWLRLLAALPRVSRWRNVWMRSWTAQRLPRRTG